MRIFLLLCFLLYFIPAQCSGQVTRHKNQLIESDIIDSINYRPLLIVPPLINLKVTSPFGYRIHPVTGKPDFHTGVDLSAKADAVFSVLDGLVKETGFNPILGNYIKIDHGRLISVYGHLSYIIVSEQARVSVGQVIGITGSTGRVTGSHLHFSIKYNNTFINPLKFLVRVAQLFDTTPGTEF